MINERETLTDVPSGLIACVVNGTQQHIAAISPRSIWLRSAAPLRENAHLKLYFYQPETGTYIHLDTESIQTGPAQRDNNAVLTWFSLDSAQIAAQLRRTMNSYARFVETRVEYGASACGQEITAYPADRDDVFCSSIEEQYRIWFENAPRLLPENHSCEIAVMLHRPELWQMYLDCSRENFWQTYSVVCGIPERILPECPPDRIYIGSESCPLLFPDADKLCALLQKADQENIQASIVTAPVQGRNIRKTDALISILCRSETKTEVIVNDWGMLEKIQPHLNHIRPVLGTLMNKRRKDPRMQWVAGTEASKHLLAENALNDPAYRRFLRSLGVDRYEYEHTGMPACIPEGRHSLHFPFFRTNCAAWCTMKAIYETGERAAQAPAEHCAHWCSRNALLYPIHLKMIGRGNCLLALEDRFPAELPANIDRIVLNF